VQSEYGRGRRITLSSITFASEPEQAAGLSCAEQSRNFISPVGNWLAWCLLHDRVPGPLRYLPQRLKVKNVQPVVASNPKQALEGRGMGNLVKPQPSRKYIHCPQIADVPELLMAVQTRATTNNLLHSALRNSKDNCIGIKDHHQTTPVARPAVKGCR